MTMSMASQHLLSLPLLPLMPSWRLFEPEPRWYTQFLCCCMTTTMTTLETPLWIYSTKNMNSSRPWWPHQSWWWKQHAISTPQSLNPYAPSSVHIFSCEQDILMNRGHPSVVLQNSYYPNVSCRAFCIWSMKTLCSMNILIRITVGLPFCQLFTLFVRLLMKSWQRRSCDPACNAESNCEIG